MDGDCGAFQKSTDMDRVCGGAPTHGSRDQGPRAGSVRLTATRRGFLRGRKVSEMLITRMNHHPKCLWLYKEEMVKDDFLGSLLDPIQFLLCLF